MDNQHRKIKGYRDLSQAEIDLMNEIKEMGRIADAMTEKVAAHISMQRGQYGADAEHINDERRAAGKAEYQRLNNATPERWAAIGRTHFQEGLMALTRAVAQPEFF